MHLPNEEHCETRARELSEELQKLMPPDGNLGIAIVVTTGKLHECGCCYQVEGCAAFRPPEFSSDLNIFASQMNSAIRGLFIRLDILLKQLYGSDFDSLSALIATATSALSDEEFE